MTKLEVAALSALALAGTGGLTIQYRASAALATELDGLRQQRSEMAAVASDNTRRVATATEIAQLRQDTAELSQLRQQVAAKRKAGQPAERPMPTNYPAGVPDDVPLPKEIFERSQVEQQPRIRFRVGTNLLDIENPVLPAEVLLEFIVDEEGNTRSVRAVSSSRPEFEAPTLQAARKWKFMPARKDGRNVAVRTQQRIVYEAGAEAGPESKSIPANR